MNVIIHVCLVYFYVCASAIELVRRNGNVNDWTPGTAGEQDEYLNQMNSTVYMSVNHYHCAVDINEDASVILYGAKSWTFSAQDVNLKLSYPSDNLLKYSTADELNIITGFKVIIYIDAMETKGYITDGGVLQDKITLSFVSHNITSISYQFWLYGIPKHTFGSMLNSPTQNSVSLCN